jgi:hypothetical protein
MAETVGHIPGLGGNWNASGRFRALLIDLASQVPRREAYSIVS